ncbi:TPA: hypothetical protein ACJINU_002182 [Escherichia coli]|uniref:terminase small subunit-like protein n=1 Tax=Escherichia coli TaxID=562 RepID=UPI0010B94848|nr:hypothetical protein [Escherichia coli]EFH7470123.1 hypothetical protein [Escherichia coli]MDZ3881978.1 hypothetical protein [Escherichia coli]GCI98622.1 phage terminase small subunit [Escherichia coli]
MEDEDKEINSLPANDNTKRRKTVKYSVPTAREIGLLVSEGHSLRAISEMEGMPSLRTLMRWQIEYPDFRELVAWMKWLHASDQAQQAVECFDDLDPEDEDFKAKLAVAREKSKALLAAVAKLDLKSCPFGGNENGNH